jgi:hypothetical protein
MPLRNEVASAAAAIAPIMLQSNIGLAPRRAIATLSPDGNFRHYRNPCKLGFLDLGQQ